MHYIGRLVFRYTASLTLAQRFRRTAFLVLSIALATVPLVEGHLLWLVDGIEPGWRHWFLLAFCLVGLFIAEMMLPKLPLAPGYNLWSAIGRLAYKQTTVSRNSKI